MGELKGLWEQYYAYILIGAGLLVALVVGGSGASRRRREQVEADEGHETIYVTVRAKQEQRPAARRRR